MLVLLTVTYLLDMLCLRLAKHEKRYINMKNWNTPEIYELDINETANGFIYSLWEYKRLLNDNMAEDIEEILENLKCPKDDPVNQPS